MGSSYLKKPGGNTITKKMIMKRMEDMAVMLTAMETTIMEWEIWYRLIPQQKKFLNQEQFEQFVMDGPILTEFPSKIMESIRNQMPKMEDPGVEETVMVENKKVILDATGLPAQPDMPKIVDSSGHTMPPTV